MQRGPLSPAALFDAAVHPGREQAIADAGLDLIARPGMAAPTDAPPGLFVIRRGLGEGRLAVVAAVERVAPSRAVLEAEGIPCEGYSDGVFIEVNSGPAGQRGLRIAGPDGLVARDVVLLQERPSARLRPSIRRASPVPPAGLLSAAERAFILDTRRSTPELLPEAPSGAPPEATDVSEGITDPIPPPRPPLAMTGTVGRGGQNAAADIRAVQDRLVELRVVEAGDIANERPSGAAAVPEASLTQTIEAIERFQRQQAIATNGTVAVRDATRAELDRAIPIPTPEELSAIDAERQKIGQMVNRGLTITGPVGATASGNAIEDVRTVQRRLVDLGVLPASHLESPVQGATGNVPQSALSATIAALRRFQKDVRFFVSKRTIAGAIAPGVVVSGDATATLLDRVSVYNMSFGSTRLSLKDHVVSGATQSEAGVMFVGTASPSALALRTFTDLGLTAGQAAALKLVSTFGGSFDAIHTYDRAIVSTGFIQFAGGRGLPPYIALLKARQPAKFRELLQKYGIDVEFGVANGAIASSRMIVLDPAGPRVLRASAAEAAIRDDKRLTTALILSGRDRDVQIAQVEAAVRGYVLPASNARIAPSARGGSARLGEILRSRKGLAALYDRAIQEGVGAATRRFERIIQRLVRNAEPRPLSNPPPSLPTTAQLQSREGDVLAELERDLQAATDVGAHIARARELLGVVGRAAGAAGATVAGLLARAELANARRAVTSARVAMPDVVTLTTSNNVDTQLATMNATLTAAEARLSQTPSSVGDLRTALDASSQALGAVAGPLSTAPGFLRRIQRIRRSTLDSGLAEVA